MRYFIYFVLGLIYSVVLSFCGLTATGMGHGTGTGVFWMLALIPIPLIFWSIIGLLLCRTELKSVRTAIYFLLAAHYLGFIVYLFTLTNQDYENFLTVWNRDTIGAIFNALFYLAGQILIWRILFFNRKARKLT